VRRGTELLAAGKNEEARDELERAAHLRPRNLKAHNLLGLTYFKLGLLDRAVGVYERLVQESPRDATLRTNLGLVHLKAGQTTEAVAQLETAVELVPDRSKALNYLGLAYAQAKTYGKARRVFERSGNTAMVRRMEAAMRGDAEGGGADLVASSDLAPIGLEMNKEQERRSAISASSDDAEATSSSPEAATLSDLLRDSTHEPRGGEMDLDRMALTLRVDGELRARLGRLLWTRGDLVRETEAKRFRGRVTEQPFGEGDDRVVKLRGKGTVALSTHGLTLTPINLHEEAVYLVDSTLLAFDASLAYENGRLPGGAFPDLELVHLRGSGKAVIRTEGPMRSLTVREGEPVQIPIERLVGWLGTVTPTLAGVDTSRWVQLQGDGWALWTPFRE
jgi:uncharacterized protein (AIM24 family)